MSIVLQPSIFQRGDKATDFSWMILQPAFADALFVFNDNQTQFEAFQAGDRTSGCSVGGGNAAIRPYQCKAPPRAAGIPTGPGYAALTPAVTAIIDRAAAYAARVARDQGYKRVIYSASAHDPGMVGTSIFPVADDVRRYFVTALAREVAHASSPAALAHDDMPVPTPTPQPVTVGGLPYELVAFYFPGKNTGWDDVYNAPFCGNFWLSQLTLTIGGVTGTFHNGEAAFQATKWWHDDAIRAAFEACATGGDAYRLKLKQHNPDYGYAGLGRAGAMDAVLAAKFADPALGAGLLATGGAYLLEHSSPGTPDDHWSDHNDGTGANALGLSLMALRADLGGKGKPAGADDVGAFTAQVLGV